MWPAIIFLVLLAPFRVSGAQEISIQSNNQNGRCVVAGVMGNATVNCPGVDSFIVENLIELYKDQLKNKNLRIAQLEKEVNDRKQFLVEANRKAGRQIRLVESRTEARTAERAGGIPTPIDGVITSSEGWCLDTDPSNVQFEVYFQTNNNIRTDKMYEVRSLTPRRLVYIVKNSPADARYVSRVAVRAATTEHLCAGGN